MTDERWKQLTSVTWFRKEQDEVTEYVESLLECIRELQSQVDDLELYTTPFTDEK